MTLWKEMDFPSTEEGNLREYFLGEIFQVARQRGREPELWSGDSLLESA
jgi:hypothetical protein